VTGIGAGQSGRAAQDADAPLPPRGRGVGGLGEVRLNGYLEDYACYADALLRLYEATFEVRWLEAARELVRTIVECFADTEDVGFFSVSDDHEALIHRPKDWEDNATPSGNSVAMEAILRLGALTGDSELRDRFVTPALSRMSAIMASHPYGFGRMLGVLDMALAPPQEIVVAGRRDDPATRALLDAARSVYGPNRVIALADPDAPAPDWLPILRDRALVKGKPAAYVCTDFVCKAPVTDPTALPEILTG